MKYEKSWKSIDEQADLLIRSKGLECSDKNKLKEALINIGYYRLSAYWFPYKITDESGNTRFRKGTTFNVIYRTYEFDRRLRLSIFNAISVIEIYLRSRLAYLMSISNGAFGYPEPIIPTLRKQLNVAKKGEQYAKHFFSKYGNKHELPPYWLMMECVTLGTIETLYSAAPAKVKIAIADNFAVKVPVFKSWISVLRVARNACCHHSRVWNRTWGIKPIIPKAWKYFTASNATTFAVLSVVYYMLEKISGGGCWRQEFDSLLREFKDVPLHKMGFYDGWEETFPWLPI